MIGKLVRTSSNTVSESYPAEPTTCEYCQISTLKGVLRVLWAASMTPRGSIAGWFEAELALEELGSEKAGR